MLIDIIHSVNVSFIGHDTSTVQLVYTTLLF